MLLCYKIKLIRNKKNESLRRANNQQIQAPDTRFWPEPISLLVCFSLYPDQKVCTPGRCSHSGRWMGELREESVSAPGGRV